MVRCGLLLESYLRDIHHRQLHHFPSDLLFFSRQDAPKALFGASRLYTALAGAIIIAIGNGVTVIALGLVEVCVMWLIELENHYYHYLVSTAACRGTPCASGQRRQGRGYHLMKFVRSGFISEALCRARANLDFVQRMLHHDVASVSFGRRSTM